MSALRYIQQQIGSLKVGQQIEIDPLIILTDRNFRTLRGETLLDQIMAGVSGGAWVQSWENYARRTLVFTRHDDSDPNVRWYVSPDRRYLFDKQPDGRWIRNDEALDKVREKVFFINQLLEHLR